MYYSPINNLEYSVDRLNRILSRKRLNFNPYTVPDKKLIDGIHKIGWGNEFDITEMVVLSFTQLRTINNAIGFDGIFMRIGNNQEEILFKNGVFKGGVIAHDTLHREYTYAGSKRIRKEDDIEWLIGKCFFVSHVVRGATPEGFRRVAYRMNRLTGNISRDAKMVREKMCEAKITMLQRILYRPYSINHLSCDHNFFNYAGPIQQFIDKVRHFSDTPVPLS